ncbi:4Fe-4S dicluster domain-containing protein [Streptomyces sp. TRM43335]|uniref:Glycolate oxidase iron-sulfur subunit n=1 Tax=Streptomyces taklimakanensis TaxID=2569853 RepID=A0A6G2BA62_9ACTN|nr:(Fe-S)-binding protein [Streptomyces taklimakanensis]MTE19016.1 4Fe-4S dicluster domain-containing protein [Streptomyces taklimakanensis]
MTTDRPSHRSPREPVAPAAPRKPTPGSGRESGPTPGPTPGPASGPGLGVFDKDLLDRCISCGFCLPACPTYTLTGQEPSSPRGRITLMRALESGDLAPDDPTLAEESSFCLGCRACEPVCPAGVRYGALLEQWRDHQWRGRDRPLIARLLMALVSRPALLRLQGLVRRHARPGRRPGAGARAGTGAPQATRRDAPEAASSRPAEPVSLMLGCVERGLYPAVSRAVRTLRPEVDVPPGQGCCGALHAHNGDSAAGAELAHALGERLPGTIVTTAGGCAAHLAHHLGRGRVRELSEYLELTGHRPAGRVTVDGRPARVALQDSCHLRNGLGVTRPPREAIAAVAEYVELPNAGDCCGAAGTYSMLRPADSRAVLAPKLAAIEAADVDYVVAVNPGCLRQLRQGLRRGGSRVRALHLAELLALAAAGEAGGSGGAGKDRGEPEAPAD